MVQQLAQLDAQIVGISPDAPADLAKTVAKNKLTFPLLSDPDLAAAGAYGLVYQRPDKKPFLVPAVFVVGAAGRVLFQYVNPNYRVRLDSAVLQAAVRAAHPSR
ncbi:MAG: redoxin domain-containing protein [Candidatus Latescibacteria bacterium]|nr:redoxin domain-containing protein [Candidatus Latescibacterota bacterium]